MSFSAWGNKMDPDRYRVVLHGGYDSATDLLITKNSNPVPIPAEPEKNEKKHEN